MKINEQILKRFFQGESGRSEAKLIAEYLEKHHEILNALFDDNEWVEFFKENNFHEVPYTEQELWDKITERLNIAKRRLSLRSSLIKWSAAACILLAASIFSLKYLKPHSVKTKVVITNPLFSKQINDSVIWHNISAEKQERRLSDGSLVYLEPGSVLKYKRNFESNRRWLVLTGKAKFIVAKNAAKPFTVVSGNISTTALGTIFLVDNFHDKKITVKLFRGKVVVKDIKREDRCVYLLPGDICAFDGVTLNKTVAVVQIKQNKIVIAPQVPVDTSYQLTDSSATFKDAPLSTVFNTISKLYKIKILYDSVPDSVMTRSVYSGIFNKAKMSSNTVLHTVTNVNDLNFEQLDSTSFRIKPQ